MFGMLRACEGESLSEGGGAGQRGGRWAAQGSTRRAQCGARQRRRTHAGECCGQAPLWAHTRPVVGVRQGARATRRAWQRWGKRITRGVHHPPPAPAPPASTAAALLRVAATSPRYVLKASTHSAWSCSLAYCSAVLPDAVRSRAPHPCCHKAQCAATLAISRGGRSEVLGRSLCVIRVGIHQCRFSHRSSSDRTPTPQTRSFAAAVDGPPGAHATSKHRPDLAHGLPCVKTSGTQR